MSEVASSYDVVVAGLGIAGLSTCRALSQRGLRVLGVDPRPALHAEGGSHGIQRVIRRAYFEGPGYIPLVSRAYPLWDQWSAEAGRRFFHRVGVLSCGAGGGDVLERTRAHASAHGVELEVPEPSSIPGLRLGEGDWAVSLERDAGFVEVEPALEWLETSCGATLERGRRLSGWTADDDGVHLDIEGRRVRAGHLVLACGGWMGSLLGADAPPIRTEINVQFWFEPRGPVPEGLPVFMVDLEEGFFYGFPPHGEPLMKLAKHGSGLFDAPENRLRHVDGTREEVEAIVERFVPFLHPRAVRSEPCVYARTSDDDFIVDRHPSSARVVVAGGFSGHGFKFGPVIGEIVADLVGETPPPFDLEFLRWGRGP